MVKTIFVNSSLTRRTIFYMNQEINKTFTGTIDQLLNHCSTLEFDISDKEAKEREYENCIKYIMDFRKIDRDDAIEIYNIIALQEVKETVDKLVSEGLLEIVSYGSDGEPKFALTSLGKQCSAEIEKNLNKDDRSNSK